MTHEQKVATAAALICAGSWLLYQTYDQSGRKRPFWTRLLPGA